jgi:hypothetical protein
MQTIFGFFLSEMNSLTYGVNIYINILRVCILCTSIMLSHIMYNKYSRYLAPFLAKWIAWPIHKLYIYIIVNLYKIYIMYMINVINMQTIFNFFISEMNSLTYLPIISINKYIHLILFLFFVFQIYMYIHIYITNKHMCHFQKKLSRKHTYLIPFLFFHFLQFYRTLFSVFEPQHKPNIYVHIYIYIYKYIYKYVYIHMCVDI